MANNSGSKWFQKSRINVDTDLLFNGIDQRVVANPLPFEFGTTDFSFSFFYEDKSLNGINGYFSIERPGGSISFQIRVYSSANLYQCTVNPSNRSIIGGSSHRFKSGNFSPQKLNVKKHVVVTRTGVDINFYINGQKLNIYDITNPLQLTDEFDFNSGFESLIIGAVSEAGGAPTNITSSHNQVFSKALSEEEIRYIYVNGGIIPESAHQYALAHYPLQSICNVDGSLFTMDAVEQYNYTKYKYLDIQEPSTSDFNTPTNGATLTGGSDSDGVYVQFDAGDPMVNSQDLSFLAFNGPLFDEPNTSGELGQTMVTKLKFKIANGSSTRIKVSRSFITTSILSEITDGSNIQELEIRDNIPSEGTGRDLIFNYSISDSSPITSSIRFYGIEYYMERKIPLTANNAIPVGFTPEDSSINTTILETLSNPSTGLGTTISNTATRLAQTFKMPQALSEDFTIDLWLANSGAGMDLDLKIVGVVGDISTGSPYPTELIGSASNTQDASLFSNNNIGQYIPFNFSGVTLQDGSTYAAVLTPSNIVSITGFEWQRTDGTVDEYTDGISWGSTNSGLTWIYSHGDPEMDYALRIQEITTTVGSSEFNQDSFKDFYNKETNLPKFWSTKYIDSKYQGFIATIEADKYTTSTDFSWIYYGTFAENRFGYTGAGNLLYMFISPLVDISLRGPGVWRLRLRQNTIDITLPTADLYPNVNIGKPFLHIIRYNSNTQWVNMQFYWFYNQKTFEIDASVAAFESFGDNIISQGAAPSSGASSASPARIIAKDYYISDEEIEIYKMKNFENDSSVFFHADFSIEDSSGAIYDRGPNNYIFNRFENGSNLRVYEPQPLAFLEKDSLMPPIKQSFNFSGSGYSISGYIHIKTPLLNIDNDRTLISFSYPIEGPESGRRLSYIGGGIAADSISLERKINNDIGNIKLGYNTLQVHADVYRRSDKRTKRFFNGILLESLINNTYTPITPTELTIGGYISGYAQPPKKFNNIVSLYYNRELSDKEIKKISNNLLFRNPDIKDQDGLICYYNMNKESFYSNYNGVFLRNYALFTDPNYSVPDFNITDWTIGTGMSIDSSSYLIHDGTATGALAADASITNMNGNDNTRVKVSFDVITNDDEFWVFIGGIAPTSKKVSVTSSSGHIDIIVDAEGSPNLFFSNTDGVTVKNTASWTVANPIIEELTYDATVEGLPGATPEIQLNGIDAYLTPICELRGYGGSTPVGDTNIWGDEVLQPIVTENDDYIEVPPTP